MVTPVLGESIGAERPSLRLSVGVLIICAVAGFVGGGVVGSVSGFAGDEEPATTDSPPPDTAQPIDLTVAGASCERDPGVDRANNPVEYLAAFAADGDSQTAWQCRGDGVGETLEIDLGGPTLVVELGLIPGYAKVDDLDGTEWYPLNRRLTEVRWHFEDGESVVQELDPDPDRRDLQTMTLEDARTTTTLTLEIVASTLGDGDRSNVAITEVEVRGTAQ
jgi:hypothetical protein